jgi:hypothetical protein
VVQGNEDHLMISIVIDGETAARGNLYVYSRSEDGQRLVHPWLAYQPTVATVFPTKLVRIFFSFVRWLTPSCAPNQATYFEGSIRVPARTREFLMGQYGSEIDAPTKAFSWTHMSYVTPHAGMTSTTLPPRDQRNSKTDS